MLPLDAVWQQWVVECAVSGQWPGLGRYQAGNLLHCPTWSSLGPPPPHRGIPTPPPPLHPARSNSYTTAGRGGYSAWNIFKKVQYLLWKSINLSSFTESCSKLQSLMCPTEQFVLPATCTVHPPLAGSLVRGAGSGHWAHWSSRSW